MQQSSSFQIYNASAGSGKTFTLVKEYLKILLLSEDLFCFQKILAITFTNKAAGEMKERVLTNLQAFSKAKQTDLYLPILKETNLNKETLQKKSAQILNAILQNYTAFSITTIDSFTHKIIKTFAYDLGLNLNFEVEMDAASLLNQSVELLLSKIGIDQKLTQILIAFSLDKINDDSSWDITRELNEFAKILLNEEDNKHFKKIAQKKLTDFTLLKTQLQERQKNIKQQWQKIGKEALYTIETMGLTHKDFYYSLLPKHFVSLTNNPEKTSFFNQNKLKERIEENIFYSKSKSDDIKTAIEGVLPILLNLYNQSETLYQQFTLNKLALKSIIPLAVLKYIYAELDFLKHENNIRLNAEFNQLISEHIKDQPAPFIYERIGQRFMHYFIDEMQDTSELQWQNLIPLIDNALAQEKSSLLLVGDGKQAIYRWRGGKATQFINLSSGNQNPFQISKTLASLTTNYRSYSEIINFNNAFFQHVAHFFENETYTSLFLEGNKQLENSKKGGCVTISFLEKEPEKETEELKFANAVFEKINSLKTTFKLNEICVLVRKKKDGITVANYLSEKGISIISSETLLLKNSKKVCFLINLLHAFLHPTDKETQFEILFFLHQHLQITTPIDVFLHQFAKQKLTAVFLNLKQWGVSFNINTFEQLPLYEKIETLIRSFNLISSSNAYIQFFLEVVLEQQQKGSSLQEFLEFWQEKKENLSIVVPKTTNSVHVMTIHKSKGLEFPVVIFPYDLDIYRQISPKVWLNQLPTYFKPFTELLIPFNKEISYINQTGLEIYLQQRQELELDNFNLLYVALTRAIEQLHIITEKNTTTKGEEKLNFYSGIFINYLKKIGKWNPDILEYSFGEINQKRVLKEEDAKPNNQQKHISSPWQEHNIVLLASASKLWDTQQGKAIDYGNLIHQIMADIITEKEIKTVITQYINQGLLPKEIALKIENHIFEIVQHPKLKEYYSENIKVYNEREIMGIDGQLIIPDRLVFTPKGVVVIDYKTGKTSKSHQQQLLKYQHILTSLEITVTKKLLVYIDETILVETL